MVYMSDTFEPCHGLTETGKAEYEKLLGLAADEILFRHAHPVKYVLARIAEFFRGE